MMKNFIYLPIFFLFFINSTFAQKSVHLDNYYKSDTDLLVTVKSITVLPFADNTRGIYAKPFESFIKNSVEENPKWKLEPIVILGRVPYLSDLENKPLAIQKYAKSVNSDAFIAGQVTRTKEGLNLYLGLFLAKDGLLFAKEEIKNITQADLKGLNSPFKSILHKLIKQIPYDGMILSRKDKLVTLSLSKADGITDGQDLTVASIIKLKRHPKFNFIISSEKVILGKLRVKKVDDSLTFAEIIVEKEKGSIQKDAKIVGSHLASFGNNVITNYNSNSDSGLAPSGNTTHGQRWRPTLPPTFGRFEATLGLGLMKASNGDAFSEKNIYPSISLDGEVWVNDIWSVHVTTRQGIASIADPDGLSDISVSTAMYELLAGYNFRMNGAFGTKFEFLAGYSRYNSTVENADPQRFTSTKYSGLKLGADVKTPISQGNNILAGATMYLFVKPHLTERPSPSGKSSSNTVTMFKAYAMKKYKENFYITGSLNFDLFSTSFDTKITASSSSQRHVTFNLGTNYFF